jgi:hypothetical protein
MVITIRRSFPWFPAALAVAWVLMMGLVMRDLTWFADFSSAISHRALVMAAAGSESSAPVVRLPVRASDCATAVAPLARSIQ